MIHSIAKGPAANRMAAFVLSAMDRTYVDEDAGVADYGFRVGIQDSG